MTDQTPQAQPAELTVPKRPEKPDEYTIWLERKINSVKTELEAKPGAESRGTVWSNFYGVHNDPAGNPHVVQFSITGRSDVSPVEALRLMLDLESFAKRQGLFPWPPTGVQIDARGNVRRETELPVDELSAPVPTAPLPAAPVTHDELTPAQGGTFLCVQLGVTPVAGGKVQLKFFSNDKKQPVNDYPTLTTTKIIPQAISGLAPTGQWTEQHFTVAQNYPVKFTVTWKQGKQIPNSKNFYKDITSIEPA